MRRVLVCGERKLHHSPKRTHQRGPEEILIAASKAMNRETEYLAWQAHIKARIPEAIIVGGKVRLPWVF